MSDSVKDHSEELDQFWDISRLLPSQNRTIQQAKPPAKHIKPAEISISAPPSKEEPITSTYAPSYRAEEPPKPTEKSVYNCYEDFSAFVKQVKIVNWSSTYNYYEFFCRQAASLYNKRGKECPEVHFFSYVAQYSQLNRGQLAWYLWWRECVRNGKYPNTDISYIYLLIFEIINLGSAIDTEKSLNILISLWSNYRETYPQLKSSLGDWICDYSLIHHRAIPFPDPRITWDMISACALPEVFFQFDIHDSDLMAKFLLSFCSAYQYRKSKFYTEETHEFYDKYLPLALQHILEHLNIIETISAQPTKHNTRVAYTGALCSYKTRKHIEIDYMPLCDSHELKALIGDVVKYAENKLRAYLGIRSRLGIRNLGTSLRDSLDEFFSTTLALSQTGDKRIPEYEKFYDVSDNEFSLSAALNIEKQSWEVTQKLVEAFEEEPKQPPKIEEITPHTPEIAEEVSETERFYQSIAQHLEFFELIKQRDFLGQKAYLQKKHLMAEAVADEINECAFEHFGDVLIEDTGEGFCLIEDYEFIFL